MARIFLKTAPSGAATLFVDHVGSAENVMASARRRMVELLDEGHRSPRVIVERPHGRDLVLTPRSVREAASQKHPASRIQERSLFA